MFCGVEWVDGIVKRGAIGAEKIRAERGGFLDDESAIGEAMSGIALKLLVTLPSGGLKKMLIHKNIIAEMWRILRGNLWYNMIMKILAIESSCDETAAAVVEGAGELVFDDKNVIRVDKYKGFEPKLQILSNVVVSQVDIFAAYGGVIPEVAARSHLEAILPVVHKALENARLTKDDIDYIAVTYAPGLLGSLLIGTLTARMLAILWQKPLYAVHHLKSHIYANWLSDPRSLVTTSSNSPVCSRRILNTSPLHASNFPSSNSKLAESEKFDSTSLNSPKSEPSQNTMPQFPLLALVISGGHTQIIYMPEHNNFEIIGTTRDDAVGECFDKVAKVLGLPYPGGPSIAKAAENGDITKYKLPHPKIDGLDFSFSGLKTAVLRAVQADCNLPITTPSFELAQHLSEQQRADFAAAFQATACDILLEKLGNALQGYPEARSVVFAGGVSANQVLRQKALEGQKMGSNGIFGRGDIEIYFPEPKFTGDNAAMVGAAAYYEIMNGVKPVDPYHLNILPRTPIR